MEDDEFTSATDKQSVTNSHIQTILTDINVNVDKGQHSTFFFTNSTLGKHLIQQVTETYALCAVFLQQFSH